MLFRTRGHKKVNN